MSAIKNYHFKSIILASYEDYMKNILVQIFVNQLQLIKWDK